MKIGRSLGAATTLGIAILAGLFASFAFGGAQRETNAGLRASLTAPGNPGRGIFVATLRGRSLRWSLTYKRSNGRVLVARLRLVRANGAAPSAASLCSPCAAIARGRMLVSRPVAQGLTRRRVLVELQVRGSSSVTLRGRIAVSEVPVLKIDSPRPGETITLPAQISYRVSGFPVGSEGVHLEVYVADRDGRHVELALPEPSGRVTLPDVKDAYLVGKHDLTFRLVTAKGIPLPNPEATVLVRDLTIFGRRGD
jgi:hypothetical protein